MRTTVTLDDDVAAAVQRLRRDESVGLSEAINQLGRAGMQVRAPKSRSHQRSAQLGLRVDVTNVAETLEVLEGPSPR